MGIADEVVLVVTRDLFRTSAPARIAPLDRLTRLVTDERPPAELASALRRVGVVPQVVHG
jgi:DeoR family transcriptional regulator of aga operon